MSEGLSAPERPSNAGPPSEASKKVGFFNARGRARELASEVDRLRAEQARLGLLSAAALERRKEELTAEIAGLQQRAEQERADAVAALERETAAVRSERDRLQGEVARLAQDVVVTEEAALLQEVGIHEYRHPLTDAVAYQSELKRLREQIKLMNRKDGGAVIGTTNWEVNGSAAQGRTMVRDFSKLMLRAYNAEADNLVRGLKSYKLESAIDRLTKVAVTIVKLGKTMDISITEGYHALRIRELELTADYLEKVAEEKERERADRERLKEERKAQQEMERERQRLEKERAHYANALKALIAKGDQEAADRLREELEKIDRAIEDVDYRAANIRAGYVYVISNVGAFGDRIVKIGLTRRIDPLDRVRELGDASVPFRFDVHALFFSKDAVGIENELHQRLADRRVNRVNLRREFFYATPQEVKEHLLAVTGDLLQYEEEPEALEYHQSVTAATNDGAPTPVVS